MNMTVTESDKKLLSFLAAFLLAIAFIFFVYSYEIGQGCCAERKENDLATVVP